MNSSSLAAPAEGIPAVTRIPSLTELRRVPPFPEEFAVPGTRPFIGVSNHGTRKSGSSNELAITK
jgi:hypothetical protein